MQHSKSTSILAPIMILFFVLSSATFGVSQTTVNNKDYELVQSAIEDYLLALYNAEPDRIERSVDTSLYKIGYYDYDNKAFNNVLMTYQQLYNLASKWNKNGDKTNEESPQIIEIYEVHDKTASAKLTAEWGIDFMHLAKVNDTWKIMSIMWQSNPK